MTDPSSRVLDALHEAAHAVAHVVQRHASRLEEVNIYRTSSKTGTTWISKHRNRDTVRQRVADIRSSFAGGEAETRVGTLTGEVFRGSSADYHSVIDEMAKFIDSDLSHITIYRERAQELVTKYWQEIEIIAAVLLDEKMLTGDDVHRILGYPLRRWPLLNPAKPRSKSFYRCPDGHISTEPVKRCQNCLGPIRKVRLRPKKQVVSPHQGVNSP